MSARGALFLGIDGGGSKTRALLADDALRVLGAAEAGSANALSVGFDAATGAIRAAVMEALASGAEPDARVEAAALGLAGVDREEDRARMDAWFAAQAIANTHVVVPDTRIILAAIERGVASGIVLVAGTGAVCHGFAPDGSEARVGGWGWLLGDEGSGFDLAIRALREAVRAADGRGSAKALLDAALAHFGCARAEDLPNAVQRAGVPRATVAAFAARVLSMADAGEPHARGLALAVARDAAGLLTTVAARLGVVDPDIAFAGGLLRGSALFREAVIGAAQGGGLTSAPRATLVEDPALGALALARGLAHAR